jgi:hypothetical protein
MFDSIRMIIMTASDPPGLRNRQIRLHIQNLWGRMLLQSQNVMPTSGNETTRNHRLEAIPEFENFSTLDEMPNFMDDFPGFQTFDRSQITGANFPSAD